MEFVYAVHNWWNGVNRIKQSLKKTDYPIRMGVISAAYINYPAIIDPIQTHPDVILTAIAARQPSRAQAQIDRYRLENCKACSYSELVADPDIDAVYIPLPNGLHAKWAIKAMEAGKHVLVEKPLCSNADEARKIRETSERTGKVALEAFHWRFHPAALRVKSLIESGEYGKPVCITSKLILPGGFLKKDDIRFKYDLAGGASMDLTYVFCTCAFFSTPDFENSKFEILQAEPKINASDPKVDDAMKARFVIESQGRPPVTCNVEGDLSPPYILGILPRFWSLTALCSIELERATIVYDGFVAATFGHSITIIDKETGKKRVEKVYAPNESGVGQPWWTTYRYMLEAFVAEVRAKEGGKKYEGAWMKLEESEKLMQLIDAVYEKAGLPKRGT